jgi:class 3 adenylate cyclase
MARNEPRLLAVKAVVLIRPSVRWHLLLAFLGVSLFAVLGGGVAIYSFLKIESVLKQITAQTVPTVLTSLGLSRRAERLVAAAPALLAATTTEEHGEHAARIRSDMAQLDSILNDLKHHEIDPGVIRAIESAVDWLTLNLISLQTTVDNGLAVGERRPALAREALTLMATMRRFAQFSLNRLDDKIATVRTAADVDQTKRPDAAARLVDTVLVSWPLVRLQTEIANLENRLGAAASVNDQASLKALHRQLLASLARLEVVAQSLDATLKAPLMGHLADARPYIEGQRSVLQARMLELEAQRNGKQLLDESTKASLQLTTAVDRLVARAEDDIRAAALEAQHNQQLSTIVLATVVVLSLTTSALIVWLYVGRNLIRRLTALSDSMLAISGGNLNAPIPTGGKDELAGMADALTVFRATAIERAAAERARANLSRYFSPNLADHLAKHPDTLELRGERRDLTFIFTDLAAFTPWVERLDPTIVVSVMNEYIGGIARIVFDHGGTVDTVVGDAVHAIFGAPLPQPDHAARAVACALAIDRFARELAARLTKEAVPIGATRIGIHTGSATVGNFGGEGYFHYTALGDAVNTAARLESANKQLGTRICVSADTAALIPDFVGRPIGRLLVKGKVNVIRAFEPLDEARSEALEAYLSVFRKLDAGDPDCMQSFASYLATYGPDPLASFHLNRLLAGKLGSTIHVAEE